jgi:hypothetical protein
MPKDASKLGHRGIGFVTFASPDAVEMVRILACVGSSILVGIGNIALSAGKPAHIMQ